MTLRVGNPRERDRGKIMLNSIFLKRENISIAIAFIILSFYLSHKGFQFDLIPQFPVDVRIEDAQISHLGALNVKKNDNTNWVVTFTNCPRCNKIVETPGSVFLGVIF